MIGTEQLSLAREAQVAHGGTVGEHLVVGEHADDEALTNFYHTRLMVPRLDPNVLARIPRRIIQKIPADMAAEFRVVPVGVDRDHSLTLAMSDPSDTHAVDEISFFTGCYVMRAVATQRQIAWCLAHYYGYVTPLGETLLEPGPEPAEAAAAPAAEIVAEPTLSPADGVPKPMRGPGRITRQVEATRHRVQPPVAAPDDDDDDDEDDDDPDANLVVYDDDDEGSGPDDTVEMVIEAEPPTGPTGPTYQPEKEPTPPELAARAGEVVVRSEHDATPASSNPGLPAVVIAAEEPEETIVALNDEDDDQVVILDRPARSSSPPPVELVESGPPASEDPVVILDTPKKRRRTAKHTRLGLGIIEAPPRARSTPSPDAEPERPAELEPRAATAVPTPIPHGDTEANATGRHARVDYDETGWDDGFGPPGTTIPPPYLGAMPDTEATGPHNAIPINVPEDESGAVSVPIARPMTGTTSERVVVLADTLADAADAQRELDQSATRLVETLRALDGATTRDAIVEALLDHLARSFGRATFFVVKGTDLVPFRSKGAAAMAPGWKNARLSLNTPSTIRDVVQARLPFRGPASDDITRRLMMDVLGRVPDELLLLPCTVRERPVGVLCGTERSHRIFHEHLSVISRGAGDAFERILKARKS